MSVSVIRFSCYTRRLLAMACDHCKEVVNLNGKDLLAEAKCLKLHNGVQIPLIGLGTWRLRGAKLAAAVCGALQEGYGLIDSASVYENEEEIRELLKKMGNPRVFITTKLQPKDAQGTEATKRAFDASIQRLGVKQLDLYLIHWPGAGGVSGDSPENRKKRLENWRALEQLYEDKKVRAIGVSNFTTKHIEDLMADGAKIVPMVNQLEWHPLCWSKEMIQFAKKHKIVLQAYSSLGSGDQRLLYNPVVNEIAKEINETPGVVLLRWALEQDLPVIPCSTSREHIRDNKRAVDARLSQDQMSRLCSLIDKDQFRLLWDPNTVL